MTLKGLHKTYVTQVYQQWSYIRLIQYNSISTDSGAIQSDTDQNKHNRNKSP